MQGYTYGQFHFNAQRGLISDLNGTATDIKVALLADTYTPGQNRHDCFSAPAWVASTAYEVGDKIIPTTATGHMYECVSAGTTGTGEPTWPTNDGEQMSDNTAVWECIANGDIDFFEITGTGYTAGGVSFSSIGLSQTTGVTTFTGNGITIAGANFTTRYGVIYDNTPAGLADKKLLAYLDFTENKVVVDANFQIVWDTEGIFQTTATQPV